MTRLEISTGTSFELGGWDGVSYSNTHRLIRDGWTCTYVEGDPDKSQELAHNIAPWKGRSLNSWVSLEPGQTLDDLMDKLDVPESFELFCLDIDGNEYWIWQSLERHEPKVVCIEYNAYCPPAEKRSVAYDPKHTWRGGYYYGASAGALYDLATKKGYSLVAFEPGLDLFFVKNEYVERCSLPKLSLDVIPQGFKLRFWRTFFEQGVSDMVEV